VQVQRRWPPLGMTPALSCICASRALTISASAPFAIGVLGMGVSLGCILPQLG
jgi:hypothetical protein